MRITRLRNWFLSEHVPSKQRLAALLCSQNDTLYETLSRKKTYADDADDPGDGKLNRVLNVFDLTSMGIGCTLGCGIYVMAGNVARLYAGPAVVLSFVVAAAVSSLSGECG